MQFGSIADTILDLIVITAGGSIIFCSPNVNSDLFKGIIGGYGLLAIIIEARFKTVNNQPVALEITKYPTESISAALNTANKSDTVLFNATLYPTNFNDIICYRWKSTRLPLTIAETHTRRQSYPVEVFLEQLARRFDWMKRFRAKWEPGIRDRNTVAWRSYAIAEDADKLWVITRSISTTILQEYFVPIANIKAFLEDFLPATKELNLINLSLRYVKRIESCLLNYAPQDMISVVIYFNIWNNKSELEKLALWTDAQIKNVIRFSGSFYLPYLLVYQPQQIFHMYPGWWRFLRLKKFYDPEEKLINSFYQHLTRSSTTVPVK